jgi:hypothetical protein
MLEEEDRSFHGPLLRKLNKAYRMKLWRNLDSFCSCEANVAAHLLAKEGSKKKINRSWHNDPLASIMYTLVMDIYVS